MGSIFRISSYHIRQWTSNPKIYCIFLCIFVFLQGNLKDIVEYVKEVQINATPFLFPFLFTDRMIGMLILAGVLVLFCDAPFYDATQKFIAARTGKLLWAWGQVFYIIIGSGLYFLFVYLFSVLIFMGHLDMTNQWGKIWNTLALGQAQWNMTRPVDIPVSIINAYTPFQAIGIELILGVLVGSFIGLLLFFLNLIVGKKISMAVVCGFILVTTRMAYLPSIIHYFCPTFWMNLNCVYSTPAYGTLTVKFAMSVLMIIDSILAIASVLAVKKKELG